VVQSLLAGNIQVQAEYSVESHRFLLTEIFISQSKKGAENKHQ